MILSNDVYRKLTNLEINVLEENRNTSDNWDNIQVKEGFDPQKIHNSIFSGKINIGIFTNKILTYENLSLSTGIYNSTIVSSEIGDNCAIHNAKYISAYVIENSVLLFNIDELTVSENPLFGNGYLKEDGSRNWISVVNESGSRKVLPFHTIETGDCHLWAKLRGDKELLSQFTLFTDKLRKEENTSKGRIGCFSSLRSCRIIRDTNLGQYSRINGISHLENITVNSSKEIPTIIGEDADLENGIVGYGSEISHGARAKNFILANHSCLKYGANFFNSFLGENSTVSCCEFNSSLVLPFHEQHHNNSFLIASLLKGQSNIGAGSTIGSNHNSRSADGEISAGRGFWTALSSSTKHNCSFASYTILAKNDFLHEMKVPTPFSLISLDDQTKHLQIMPAYWFMFNMYALTRNSWKFKQRDRRFDKSICIETEYIAPDTVEEIFTGLDFLIEWAAGLDNNGQNSEKNLKKKGIDILESKQKGPDVLKVDPYILEYSKNPVIILKPKQAYAAYKDIIILYCIKVLCLYAEKEGLKFVGLNKKFHNAKRMSWINIGGQLVQEDDFNSLIGDIKDNKVSSWNNVHLRYRNLAKLYPVRKAAHAYASLLEFHKTKNIDKNLWNLSLEKARNINTKICANIYQSRLKDHKNLFRHITFESKEEGQAILGNIEDNPFLLNTAKEKIHFEKLIKQLTAV